ncbi:MAG: hypothetical protein LWX07_04845 [Bacteroidetes bacterium]|nr:hypothetical protein [Bacteroidota bacterium]
MKYFIAVTILFAFCISAKAQTTAGNDDKAAGASIGQNIGYSYGVTYTVVNGQKVENDAEKIITHTGSTVSADKNMKPADINQNGRYPYEVIYTSTSGDLVQSGKK